MTKPKLNKQTRAHGRLAGLPRLLGGRLCLDFVNTVEGRISSQPEECLPDSSSLIRWAYHVALISEGTQDKLLDQAGQSPERAVGQYEQAVALREALYRIFLAVAQKQPASPEQLNVLRTVYLEGLSHAKLRAGEAGIEWTWTITHELAGIAWTVARSAVDLLTSPEARRIKQCPGCEDCGWLFFDATKSGTRQWCSMEGCGSRAKTRRQYKRQHEAVAL